MARRNFRMFRFVHRWYEEIPLSRQGDVRTNIVKSAENLKVGDIFYITCIDSPKKLNRCTISIRIISLCISERHFIQMNNGWRSCRLQHLRQMHKTVAGTSGMRQGGCLWRWQEWYGYVWTCWRKLRSAKCWWTAKKVCHIGYIIKWWGWVALAAG